MIEDIAEVLDEFKREVMPATMLAIKAHKAEYPDDWRRERRIDYLKTRIEGIIYRALIVSHNYDVAVRNGDNMATRIFLGEQLTGAVKTIEKLQKEIFYLKKLDARVGEITDDMIARAKEYPMESLLPTPLRMGRCACPVHGGKNTMSFSVKDNYGRCFSCSWHGDTIKYMQDVHGLTFADAVRRLQ